MGNKKVGFLTIGQSPRDDVLADIQPLLSPQPNILQAGALDNLNLREINKLAPTSNDFSLITRLKRGNSVVVGRSKIIPFLQVKINELEAKGAEVIVLLCTENFPELTSKKSLILPFELMKKEIINFSPARAIVFVPLKEQEDMAKKKWQSLQGKFLIAVLNPYEKLNNFEKLVSYLASKKASLILFDCIGYPISLSQSIADKLGVPYLNPRLLIAHQVNQAF